MADRLTIAEAAARTGIATSTLRGWCRKWPGLAIRRGGRDWLLDVILVDEMATALRAGTLHAPLTELRKAPPKPAPEPRVDPSRTSFSTREAAALLEVGELTVQRYSAVIKGFASRPGERGPWRIDAGMLACVGAVRLAAGGRMPLGTLVKETERHHRLMAHTLHALRTPAAIEQLARIAAQRIQATPIRKKRPRARPTPAPAAGGVRHDRD